MALSYKAHVRRQLFTLYSYFPKSRFFSSRSPQQSALSSPADTSAQIDNDLSNMYDRIRAALQPNSPDFASLVRYQFESGGKAVRPTLITLVAKSCNQGQSCTESQSKVAMIAEMIHVASLVHDDLLDGSPLRRGRSSVQHAFGHRQAVLAGDYILSVASQTLAKINHPEVVVVLSQVIEDLVSGEILQLGTKDKENDRLNHYLKKTYQKTASLMANSCQAVSLLSPYVPNEYAKAQHNAAFEVGRNFGMVFQLTDDLLDFESSASELGKPAGADLKLGLSTGPVLFAAQGHPELRAMMLRKFSEKGDVEHALRLVQESNGLQQTRSLANVHAQEAMHQLDRLPDCAERFAVTSLLHKVLHREK